MPTTSLRRRATVSALCVGMVTFVLALLVTTGPGWHGGDVGRALVPAIVCAMLCWATAHARILDAGVAIDDAVERLAAAAGGDLSTPVPTSLMAVAPQLGLAMGTLFRQHAATFDRVHHLAAFDPVTGLANRVSFRAQADAVLDALPAEASAALFFIDLDRFKSVNDSRGHATGDQLLMAVAQRLRAVAGERGGEGTLIGRLAGDEFTILDPDVTDGDQVQRLGEAILAALAEPFELPGGVVTIGGSIGVALRPEHGTTLHELMGAADAAMYQSKAEGRARMSRYSDRLAAELTGRDLLDHELGLAIQRGEFALVFQPQVAAADHALVASEALLRWRHPSGELRPAGKFLKRAEANGQMVAIGDWVATAVARAAAEWHRAGLPGRIALNISRRQLEDATFFRRLDETFAAVGVPLDRIELELQEAIAMRCSGSAVAALAALRARGARVTIDDFGAAESNLQRLRHLPIDRIKLDPTLVGEVVHDRVAREILQALVRLVHGLGCEAVAEGVETDAQVEVLRVLGCDAIQGWAIAHPMDRAALERWIDREPAEVVAAG